MKKYELKDYKMLEETDDALRIALSMGPVSVAVGSTMSSEPTLEVFSNSAMAAKSSQLTTLLLLLDTVNRTVSATISSRTPGAMAGEKMDT